MNIVIDTGDLAQLRQGLQQFSDRRFESGLAEALNKTARSIYDEWGGQLATRIDRPTQPTQRGAAISRADVGRLAAAVGLKDVLRGEQDAAPAEYLAPQEFGGDRKVKKFERALQAKGVMPPGSKVVPGKYAKIDGYGNIARGQIVQVLNQLGDQLSKGYRRVISVNAAKRARAASRAGRVYVAVPTKTGGLAAGIYERVGANLLPVFFFVARTRYGQRLALREHGLSIANRDLAINVQAAMQRRAETLMARGTGSA